jgi:hypothetical protein
VARTEDGEAVREEGREVLSSQTKEAWGGN